MTESVEPRTTPDWDHLLTTVRAESLDCLQSNLALVADHFHGPHTHLALGARWGFEPDPDTGLAKSPDRRKAEARRTAGVGLTAAGTGGANLRRVVADEEPLYVLGDAHSMSWLPYFGHEHMTHSFLLCAGPDDDHVTVVDAYHNDTPRGTARPGRWVLPVTEIDAMLDGAIGHLPERVATSPPNLPTTLIDNARRLLDAAPVIEDYLTTTRGNAADPEAVARLVLDIWSLGRERALHEHWLRHAGLPAASIEPVTVLVGRWRALATQSYVALRRTQRGGAVEPRLIDQLEDVLRSEADIAGRLAVAHGTADEALTAVRCALQDLLEIDSTTLDRALSLRDLPGFDSFRLVEVLDLVEHRLGRQWNPAALSAESLRDAASLARLFASSPGGSATGARS